MNESTSAKFAPILKHRRQHHDVTQSEHQWF
jgi:hypothetical protein